MSATAVAAGMPSTIGPQHAALDRAGAARTRRLGRLIAHVPAIRTERAPGSPARVRAVARARCRRRTERSSARAARATRRPSSACAEKSAPPITLSAIVVSVLGPGAHAARDVEAGGEQRRPHRGRVGVREQLDRLGRDTANSARNVVERPHARVDLRRERIVEDHVGLRLRPERWRGSRLRTSVHVSSVALEAADGARAGAAPGGAGARTRLSVAEREPQRIEIVLEADSVDRRVAGARRARGSAPSRCARRRGRRPRSRAVARRRAPARSAIDCAT